jgi:UrcA family protein
MLANRSWVVGEVVVKIISAISAGALMLLCGNLMAQNPAEVKVEATRVLSKETNSRGPTNFPMTDLSLAYGVSLAGLNLATKSGADEAEKRVNAAAAAACKEIGRQYPEATSSENQCVREAAKKAMAKVNELVLAAEKTAANR